MPSRSGILPIDDVRVGDRLRKVDPEKVSAIGGSIAEIGLQTPIHVAEIAEYADGREQSAYVLVAGLHRLMACRALGHSEIAVIVIDLDEIDRGIWECDENLARSELSDASRAKFTARRKELYEIKHPETRHGGDRKSSRQVGDLNGRFTADTAAASGKSERTIQRDARRGEKIAADVLDAVEGTEHDKGVVLDHLARLDATEQRKAVKALSVGKPMPEPRPRPVPKQKQVDYERAKGALLKAWHASPRSVQDWFRNWLETGAGDEAAS